MEIFGQYELIRLIHDGEVRTFTAREVPSGRMLLVHKLAPASKLFEAVRRLTPADLGLLVGAGEWHGCKYIATYDVEALHNFERFILDRVGAEPVPIASAPASQKIDEADDFARLFGESAAAPALEPEQPAPASEPGEFTQMFRAAATPTPVPPVTPLPADAATDGGEFTQFFRVPPPQPGRPEPVAHADASSPPSEPGEFTKVFRPPSPPGLAFQGPNRSGAGDDVTKVFRPPSAAPQPVPETGDNDLTKVFRPPANPPVYTEPAIQKSQSARADEPGEFTKMFRPPPAPQPAGKPAAPTPDSGEFTKLFRPTAGSQTQPDRPSQAAGPGEFTKIFRPPATPAPSGTEQGRDPMSGRFAPGTFTGFFSSQQAAPEPPVEYAVPAPEPARPPDRDPSEFTRMFGRPSDRQPEQPFAAAEPANPGGGATGIFAKPQAAAPPPRAGDSPGVGEYTRMFEAPVATPATDAAVPVQPTPAAAAPGKTPAKSSIPLILILSFLAVAAISLILYFALRK